MKKLGIGLVFLMTLTVVVNLLLALISKILPVRFVMPEGLVEPAREFGFVIGNINFKVNQTVLNTWVLMILIMVIVILSTKDIGKSKDKALRDPSKLQVIKEEYYKFIEKTFLVTYGDKKKEYVGFFSALFAIILFSNLSLFLFPFIVILTKGEHGLEMHHFFRTPTADPNTTVGLALVVLIVSTIAAIKGAGAKNYFKSYIEPMWFMLPLNIVEKISSVLNTSMRLFGNMLAGLVIAGLLYSLVGRTLLETATKNVVDGLFSFSVGWPMVLQLYLDLFVGIIQAFVFTILSSVYVSESLAMGNNIEEEIIKE